MRTIFGPKRHEVSVALRKLYDNEIRDYSTDTLIALKGTATAVNILLSVLK
jgi:hypothetical protein